MLQNSTFIWFLKDFSNNFRASEMKNNRRNFPSDSEEQFSETEFSLFRNAKVKSTKRKLPKENR